MNWSERYAKKSADKKVWQQLEESYPEDAMGWIKDAKWTGPVEVPINQIDFSNEKSWRSWHEPELVNSKIKKIKKGKRKPVILIGAPKNDHYIIIDGHHRSLAYKRLGMPITAFIGIVDKETGDWDTFHSKQLAKDPESKI